MFEKVTAVLILSLFVFGCDGTLEADYAETEATAQSQEEAYADDPADDPTVDSKADNFDTPTTEDDGEVEPAPDTEGETETQTEPEEPTRPEPGSIVSFEIADGTGSGAWNSRDNPVEVYVGQKLVVYNNDSRSHRIHSPENGPFPHGQEITPGGFATYEIEAPLELGNNPTLYDHNDGPNAAFWLRAIE